MSKLLELSEKRTGRLVYDIRLISSNTIVKMRPYTVGEEKQILIAEATQDFSVMINTLKDVISACSFGMVKNEDLSDADIQFVILQLKAKSKDNNVHLTITCDDCLSQFNIKADLNKVSFGSTEEHKNEIQIDDMVFYLRDPSTEELETLTQTVDETIGKKLEVFVELIAKCLMRVATPDEVIDCTILPIADRVEFLYSIDTQQLEKVNEFIQTIPKFLYEIKCTCPKCKKKIISTIRGLNGFFFS